MTGRTTTRTTTEGTTKRKRTILAVGALLLAVTATAQPPEPPSLAPMQRLDFLVGTWEGEGWMEFEPGRRATFTSKEIVEPRLGGRVIVVEGLHHAPMPGKPEPVLVHHAMGVFSHQEGDAYRFHTWLANGHGGEHAARLEDGAVIWGYDDPRRGEVRYTITLSESGEWVEVGDSSKDGETWTRFFEMRLAKR